jgi:hypothetical protein
MLTPVPCGPLEYRLKSGRKRQIVRKAKTGWKSREIGFRKYVRMNDSGLGKGQDLLIF